jgi:hypothetical protein
MIPGMNTTWWLALGVARIAREHDQELREFLATLELLATGTLDNDVGLRARLLVEAHKHTSACLEGLLSLLEAGEKASRETGKQPPQGAR